MMASVYMTLRLDLYQLSGYLNSFILCHFHIHVHYLIATKLEEGVVNIVNYMIEILSCFLLISLSSSFREVPLIGLCTQVNYFVAYNNEIVCLVILKQIKKLYYCKIKNE